MIRETLLIITLICTTITVTLCCSCGRQTFCNYINYPDFEGVIWIGEFIDSYQINRGQFTGYQYKVKEIIKGELVIGDSLWTHERSFFSYDNTDSSIWVFGGSQGLCYEVLPKAEVLFATIFDQTPIFDEINQPIGYKTSLCAVDFFPISDDNEVSGYIDNIIEKTTYSIEDMRTIIAEGCVNLADGIKELDRTDTPAINFYPNPTDGRVFMTSPIFSLSEASVSVYNVLGQEVWQRDIGGFQSVIDLSNSSNGVYFINIEIDDRRYVKRIVKQSL